VSVVANVAINVDSRGATQKLRELQAQSQQTERAFTGLGATVGKLASTFAVIEAAKFVFAKTAEIETQTRSLEVLTGSAAKAGQIIKELQDLGAVTPFTSTELIDSAKRLQAFGVEADKVVKTTKRLADVSGATGAELQGLVTAYGQVQAKGRLQGEELLQFQERGVALQEELRKMYGLSGDEFQKALSKGRISAEAVEVAITRLTSAGGKYANGAIAQSDTLSGKFSTLQDGVESLARVIGQKLAPVLKTVLNTAIGAVNAIGNVISGGFAKEAINLRSALILPGGTVGDLQKILDLTKAISTQGLGEQGLKQIANEIKTNQTTVSNVLANINKQRPFGVSAQEQSLAEAIQAASQKKIAELQKALDTLKAGQKQTQPPPSIPDLLPETGKEKQGRQLSVSDLLGGDIQRQLQQRQSKLEVATAREMNVAAGRSNAEQAKRMVESASKLLDIKYQIDAIDQTITARDQVRAQIIASSKDKTYAALAFDEQTNDLKTTRANLERNIDRVMLEQLGKAESQYRQEQQAIQDVLTGLDSEIIKLGAVSDAEKQALQFIEIENKLKQQGIALTDADAEAIRRKIAEIQKLTKEQQAANDKAKFMEQQFAAIGSALGDQLMGVFDNLINKTRDWNDVLRDSLMSIGKVLMMAGLNMLAGTDGKGVLSFLGFGTGFGKRAAGGPVTGRTPYVVGERGPELFVPGTGGSVVPTSDLRAAMGSAPGSAGGPVLNMSFETTNIGGVEYVSREQLEAAMAATRKAAANDGARQGTAATLSKLQQSPSTRAKLGLR